MFCVNALNTQVCMFNGIGLGGGGVIVTVIVLLRGIFSLLYGGVYNDAPFIFTASLLYYFILIGMYILNPPPPLRPIPI